jgi:hypothetical protein
LGADSGIGRFAAPPKSEKMMTHLVLRNNRLDAGTWFVTALVFALGGVAALVGLIVMNINDPTAKWMGPAVKVPQTIYLIFDGFVLLITAGMMFLAFVKRKQMSDKSVQLTIDENGIHGLRTNDNDLAWDEVSRIKLMAMQSGGIATMARLVVNTSAGDEVGIDILGLDQDPQTIVAATQKIMKDAKRGP